MNRFDSVELRKVCIVTHCLCVCVYLLLMLLHERELLLKLVQHLHLLRFQDRPVRPQMVQELSIAVRGKGGRSFASQHPLTNYCPPPKKTCI